jgi:hypothetical protein
LLAEGAARRARARVGAARVEAAIQDIAGRRLDPYTAVEEILGKA